MAPLSKNNALKLAILPLSLVFSGSFTAQAQDNAVVAVAPQAVLPATTPEPASSGWRNEIGTFKIGLVRGWSSDMSRLALYRVEGVFSKALGLPVKVVVFERFTSLMDAQADGRVDLAAYSARAFATVKLMCECVDAVASPTSSLGDTGQVTVLAVDPAKISSLASVGPAKIGRIGATDIASQEILRGSLTINGAVVTGGENFWVDFPDFSSAIKAYHNLEIDGLVLPAATSFANQSGAGSSELNLITRSADGTKVRPASALWRSPFWPYGPIALRKNIDPEAKDIVLRTLEQMDVSAPASHAVLSENLSGPFRKTDGLGYGNVSTSIRILVSQKAKWR